MKTQFKTPVTGETITFTFIGECLRNIDFGQTDTFFSPQNPNAVFLALTKINGTLTPKEVINTLAKAGFEYQKPNPKNTNNPTHNPKNTNEKVSLFCSSYEKHKGVKYKVSGKDIGVLKNYDINFELLEYYFTCNDFLFEGKQSIYNLTKYYNELVHKYKQAQAYTPNSTKIKDVQKYPLPYSRKYELSLYGTEKLTDYWAFLKANGYTAVKDKPTDLIPSFWILPNSNTKHNNNTTNT
jgi:hypothetical protein